MVRTTGLKGYSDVHFTDSRVASAIVNHFKPSGKILEPFKGEGAFLEPLLALSDNNHVDWCEISLGRDFLLYEKKVDWIVTNPPFEALTRMMEKAFSLSNHTVFLIPISKYFSSSPRLKLAKEYGGLKEMLYVGTGRDIGFDIGFPFAAMHFEKEYCGPIFESELRLDPLVRNQP